MEGSREWLDQFPAEHRGAVANYFYQTIRHQQGEVSLSALCSRVFRHLIRMEEEYARYRGQGVDKRAVIEAMENDPDGARAFMAWVIEQEARSPEQKASDKETAEQEGKRRYMEGLPPTEKQLAVLERLGVAERPENRWEASQLIEAHKTW